MKPTLFLFAVLILVFSCKTETKQTEPDAIENELQETVVTIVNDTIVDKDILENQALQQTSKKEKLIQQEDEKEALQELITSKQIYKEDDHYVLDYTYPYLNEAIDANYVVFNSYLKESYLNVERTVNEILEDKELLCDTLKIDRFREKRIIDYKVHSTTNNLISILLYKENFYSGMRHSAYTFDCLNYNTQTHSFIYFNDFFVPKAETELRNLINETITNDIKSGDMYYDCWQLTEMDFRAYKNNFVVNGDFVAYYFDDCVICPSYTGTYSIKLPLLKIMHLIQQYQQPIVL